MSFDFILWWHKNSYHNILEKQICNQLWRDHSCIHLHAYLLIFTYYFVHLTSHIMIGRKNDPNNNILMLPSWCYPPDATTIALLTKESCCHHLSTNIPTLSSWCNHPYITISKKKTTAILQLPAPCLWPDATFPMLYCWIKRNWHKIRFFSKAGRQISHNIHHIHLLFFSEAGKKK